MKKFVFALVLFLVLLACGIGYQAALGHMANALTAHCAAVERTCYDGENAAQAFDALEAAWEKSMRYLPYLIDHQHLNALSQSVAELGKAIDAGAEPEILMVAARVRRAVQSLYADECFVPKNIF